MPVAVFCMVLAKNCVSNYSDPMGCMRRQMPDLTSVGVSSEDIEYSWMSCST